MLKLLLGLAGAHSTSSTHCASECSTDAELDVYPRLMATAFIPRHLPDRVFFLTSNLLVIRRLLQSTNLCMYDHDLTFVPDSEWVSGVGWMPWASLPMTLYSLVRIRQSGSYSGSLGIVLAVSPEFGNESLVVAVVPKLPHPTSSAVLRESDRDTSLSPPGSSRKRQKLDHRVEHSKEASSSAAQCANAEPQRQISSKAPGPKLQARLFDPDQHQKRMGGKSPIITHRGDTSLADFFSAPSAVEPSKPRFPPEEIVVPDEFGQRISTTFHIDSRKLLWAGKPTLPVHELDGKFYWKGLLLVPIYRYTSVDRAVPSYFEEELIPFVEAEVAPSVIRPLLSQLYWKRGDKIIEESYYEPNNCTSEAIVFKIDEVMMHQGVVWATPIQLVRRDGQQLTHTWLEDMGLGNDIDLERRESLPQDLRKKVEDGRQECPLATHCLYLAPGDHVKILAGQDRGVCGHVIVSTASEVSLLPKGFTKEVSLPSVLEN